MRDRSGDSSIISFLTIVTIITSCIVSAIETDTTRQLPRQHVQGVTECTFLGMQIALACCKKDKINLQGINKMGR